MRIVVLFLSFILISPVVCAHNVNVKGYKDRDSKYISQCGKKNYGYHKQNGHNHWHEVVFNNQKWKIINSNESYDSNPCLDETKIPVTLVKCVDGDTAVLKMNNEEIKFRFLGVDTPESVHPTKEVEVYAKEASKNTCDLLTNAATIYIEYDSNSDQTDKYGRHLAWIWIDEMLLQELMINEGFARVAYVYGDYKYIDNLCNLQLLALENKKGIWQYDYEVGYCENKKITSKKDLKIKNVYTVTFINSNNVDEVTVAEGMTIKERPAESKVGYKFLGWYNNEKEYNFNNPIKGNITLVAKYRIDYFYIIVIIAIIIIGGINKIKDDKDGKNHKKSVKSHRKKRI